MSDKGHQYDNEHYPGEYVDGKEGQDESKVERKAVSTTAESRYVII